MYAAGLLGGIVACFLMRIAGRRTLYIYGCFGCAIALLAAGIVGTLPESRAVSWAVGSLIVLNVFIYDSTIGPVCYSLVAEIPATRLRAKTVGLGRVMYNVVTVVISVLLPKMLNPTAWDLKGRSCYLFAILSFLCTVWCYFRLPEPKGLTYMELDILFEKRADARKFKRFQSKLANSGYFYLNENGAVGPDEQWSESYRAHKVGHIS